jgi:RecA/RadA recombinase
MKKNEIENTKANLIERILKNSKSDLADVLDKSEFFNNTLNVPLDIPIMNIGFSGNVRDGFSSGMNIIAGPSRHFKSMLGLMAVKAFLNKFKDGIVIFYDSEFGTPKSYFENLAIDTTRIIHNPIENIEQLKFDIVAQIEDITSNDHVLIFIDSLGGLGSKKEVEDALEAKSVADMTRAKEIKSLMRIITPKLNIRKIPCFLVAHTYNTMEFMPKQVLGGGQGMMLAPNTVWFVSRSKLKDADKNIEGYTFTIKIEKSRLAKEESRLPIQITHDKGIKKYSGLIDLAVGFGLVNDARIGKKKAYDYKGLVVADESIAEHEEFWNKIFKETKFLDMVENKYTLGKKDETGKTFEFEDEKLETEGEKE